MKSTKQKLVENKIRQMVKEVLNEGPNSDAQLRIVNSIKSTCDKFLNGKLAGLLFVQQIQTDLKDFKQTTGK